MRTAGAEMVADIGTDGAGGEVMARLLRENALAYRLAARVLGSAEGAEDVVQQAYLAALVQLRGGRPPRKERAWFVGVVANTARKHARTEAALGRRHEAMRAAAERMGQRAAAGPETASGAPEDAELVEAVRRAVAGLDEKHRLPVVLCCEEELSQREAAAALGIAESTLSHRLRTGLDRLRAALTEAGYAGVTPAAALGLLARGTPAAPAGLAAAVEAFLSSAAAGKAAAAGVGAGAAVAATGASLAAWWKLAAGLGLAALLAFGGREAWRQWRPAGAAPAAASAPVSPEPGTPNPEPGTVSIIPRTHDAWEAFSELQRKGGPKVSMLGGRGAYTLLVPVELRFQEVESRELIEAVAAAREMKVAWVLDGKRAVLYAGCADAEVERAGRALASGDVAARREGAWLAGWQRDIRAAPLLVKAAKDADAEVARQAMIGLRRMSWEAALALDETATELLAADLASQDAFVRRSAASALGSVGGEKSLALIEKALADQDASVRWSAAYALGSVGGEKSLALIEKALADQDAGVRGNAAYALGRVGGEKARDLLLARLTVEKDRNVLVSVSGALRSRFLNDSKVVQALKDFKLPEAPKTEPTPKPGASRKPATKPLPPPEPEVF